jgi:hypothetical protein
VAVPNDQLGPLAALLGTWVGTGRGDYPTIEPFEYTEHVEFGHVGKPFLTYRQRTRNAVTGDPLHAETGYVRAVGDGAYELVIAQPTGFTELHSGRFENGVLDLHPDGLGRTPTAKAVHTVRRRLVLDGDTLTYDLWMAHADTPETHHLHAELHRQE